MNLLHGLVGLIWLAGIRRFAGPLGPGLHAGLLLVALVLPAVATAFYLSGLFPPPEGIKLLRADLWVEAVQGSRPILGFVVLLAGGTALIVLVQEIAPALRHPRQELRAERETDARLDAALERVTAQYAAHGFRLGKRRSPRALALRTERGTAALHGFLSPVLLVSRGLMDRLDDAELDAVVAHVLAHLYRGGNGRLVAIWIARILQAASPPALILFRGFLEAQEAACDALAARVSGRPAAMAHALLKMHGRPAPLAAGAGALERARAEIYRRSDLVATRLRVRALLDNEPSGRASRTALAAATLTLGAMLWAIA